MAKPRQVGRPRVPSPEDYAARNVTRAILTASPTDAAEVLGEIAATDLWYPLLSASNRLRQWALATGDASLLEDSVAAIAIAASAPTMDTRDIWVGDDYTVKAQAQLGVDLSKVTNRLRELLGRPARSNLERLARKLEEAAGSTAV